MPINLDISRDSWTVQQREYLLDFSPTAIALGSSAIVKVSGLNRFRTLHGSLKQACLGPPEGSANVPPSLRQFRGVSGLLGQIRAAKRFCGRLQQGFTEVPPRFHQGCACFVFSLIFWGRSSWAAKRFRGRFHQGCASFVISLVFWGASVLDRFGLPKGSEKVPWKAPSRFHQGFTEVPPRFHQISANFVISLVFWGKSVLGCQILPSLI